MTTRFRVRPVQLLAAALIVLLTAAGLLTGSLLEKRQPEQWQASTTVLIHFWGVETYLLTGQSQPLSSQDVINASIFASSDEVLNRAGQALGRDADDLDVTVTPVTDANSVSINATEPTPAAAKKTSAAVAAAMVAALQNRIVQTAAGLADTTQDQDPGTIQVLSQVQQRVQALTQGVQPLVPLGTDKAEKLSPTGSLPWTLAAVGLAAGLLLAIALLFTRPRVARARDAQRMLGVPAVGFGGADGDGDAGRLVRRLLDGRPEGKVLVVPATREAEKAAAGFTEWARSRAADSEEETRIQAMPEPSGTVLAARPRIGEVAALVLLVPRGASRRVVGDATALLAAWHPADAVVVTA